MKNIKTLAVLTVLGLAVCSSALAQGRPGGSGQRPPNAPQRPADSYGKPGQKPADAPSRPADSYGKRGQRPADAPQRPR